MKKKYQDNQITCDLKLHSFIQVDHLTDEQLLLQWRNSDGKEKESYLSSLYSRHNLLLKQLARKFTKQYPDLGGVEDNLQNAYVGALMAYKNFNFEKAEGKNKLITYLHITVWRYLQSCMNEQDFVHCPTYLRAVRSYFAGKWDHDPQKKQDFEKKYSIQNSSDYYAVSQKYQLIAPDSVSLIPEVYEHTNSDYVEHINFDSIAIEHTISSLSDFQKQVLQLAFVDKMCMANIVEKLNYTCGGSITSRVVQNAINDIRGKFSAFA